MADPRTFHFKLPALGRPHDEFIPETWYPGVRELVPRRTSSRQVNPITGVVAVVIHATAGGNSAGAISAMRDREASFHWLIPGEQESEHGKVVWACAPEALAAWHVRNDKFHPEVNGGRRNVNRWSLGIEVVNRQDGADPFSDWQVAIAAKVVRYCWAKYPNLVDVVSHAKLDPARRSDPGSTFPWSDLEALVLRPPAGGPEGDLHRLAAISTSAAEALRGARAIDPCTR
jgi:N-acetylmuramoyl-L-alanine amidase